jgi:hypothetical protein
MGGGLKTKFIPFNCGGFDTHSAQSTRGGGANNNLRKSYWY